MHGFECNLEKKHTRCKKHANFSKIAREIMLLLTIYMTKLCRTESNVCVTCKIIYSLNCRYFNNEKTYLSERQKYIKLCVLITKIVKITRIALYFL